MISCQHCVDSHVIVTRSKCNSDNPCYEEVQCCKAEEGVLTEKNHPRVIPRMGMLTDQGKVALSGRKVDGDQDYYSSD